MSGTRTDETLTTQWRLFEPEPWMKDGYCNGCDPDAWFPAEPEAREPGVRRNFGFGKAKDGTPITPIKICRACPVQQTCYDFAIERDEEYGIWGGVNMQSDAGIAARMARRQALRAEGIAYYRHGPPDAFNVVEETEEVA